MFLAVDLLHPTKFIIVAVDLMLSIDRAFRNIATVNFWFTTFHIIQSINPSIFKKLCYYTRFITIYTLLSFNNGNGNQYILMHELLVIYKILMAEI